MKTVKAGLKNWQTTVVGLLLAALVVLQRQMQGGMSFDDPNLWVAVGIAVLGFLMRDASVTSEQSGLKVLLVLACAAPLMLSGCETMNVKGSVAYIDSQTGAKAGMQMDSDKKAGWWVKMPWKTETGEGVAVMEGDIPIFPEK